MQLRQILGVLEYTEEQKAKLHSYLDFVTYCEQISRGNNSGDISLRDLGEYSSNIQVGMKIQQMERKGVIDSFQKDYLLSKYLEVCSAGADFEHRLLLLEPMINGQVLTQSQSEIVTYPVSEFDGDSTVKKIAISLLISFLRGHQNENYTVIIFDKGYGERGSLTQFTNNFPSSIDTHLFSKDIFTLSSGNELGMIFNRFTTRIYTRHLSESSCEAVEKECGEMDVVKASYSVTYDRRWRANRPIDVLMGNNKQEVYSTGTPIREPRYRKEDIAKFQPGTGIAKYMGQHILFSL